jgi:hypothetical protein
VLLALETALVLLMQLKRLPLPLLLLLMLLLPPGAAADSATAPDGSWLQ